MIDQLPGNTQFYFFTGKGGVGKTSSACAMGLKLAQQGKRVLIVSTDPASNLDAVLGTELNGVPTPVDGVENLWALNIDPEEAAREYRERVVGPFRGVLPADSVASIEEQLSGACTVEVAAFDEFTSLMTQKGAADFDHIVFDTAPTGHTLRLLQLPAAWSTFIETNERGASCLGPLSGLKNQQARYAEAFDALADGEKTTLMLVTRPEKGALNEAERTRVELAKQGIRNQFLIINGVFRATNRDDIVALKMESLTREALESMPSGLAALPSFQIPLKPYNVVGLKALSDFFEPAKLVEAPKGELEKIDSYKSLVALADEVEAEGHGLVMFMGKGGVGKTTMAAAFAVELAMRGHDVHLTTTDPAAHLEGTLQQEIEHLKVSRIDPVAETEAYTKKIIERSKDNLDAEGLELLKEDLRSPCTEEVAVFHAFSRMVMSAKREIVVMDTAPTGHTLLLLDATGSYHKEMLRQTEGAGLHISTPLMRLQDPSHTKVVLVTLAETTPVQEAAHLQEDLRRAEINPYAWVVNRSLAATHTTDPLLMARAVEEVKEIQNIAENFAKELYLVPWSPEPPTGAEGLRALLHPR